MAPASAADEPPVGGPDPDVPDLDVPDPALLRQGYRAGRLEPEHLAPTWVEQFAAWFIDAATPGVGVPEANAAVFATASAAGRPSARTVLLKGFDQRGFVIYTNYASRKGREATENPFGSLVFPWYALERQVVVIGSIERVSRAETERYFQSRPHGSQLGAWASHQSTIIESRTVLDDRAAELAARWPEGTRVPTPEFWGGLRIVPDTVEFWQGRADRLHDRLRYRRVSVPADGGGTDSLAVADPDATGVRVGDAGGGDAGGGVPTAAEDLWVVERLAP
ncbi:Pyridoxamine 5'-phosphate oxidase [Frankia casuarinae]|nr:Pyridoxamine 5'-phosphate oxidase [Frankia casuarinae]ETA02805.1 Pyridoxamine 5'-phosphate oxidase [Frankia sp. CcI6]KDA44312.1 Pyridoxamine 5'-phosphate oxidase [Frankia sp. BMG5.23]KEZ35881.1 Pyridoxamine 5'-phosphate oxidase [Frankia sp. CeD]KFB06759.1 Pyridoxamine 5'-phosphate oxidase [Frankia sp. Allo2]TFE29110.1 pyridoxamine 5'-phosphate oxidase [Frankia sp. B2]